MSFESVYDRHFESLFRYVHRWTQDVDVAEDIVQETFVRYLRSTVPEEDAKPWIFRVATNLLRDHHRRGSRRRTLLRKWSRLRPSSWNDVNADRAVDLIEVRRILGELPERDRTMLLMREEGFSYDEIAAVTGVAPGSVGTLLARALRRFKESYEQA